MRFARAAKDDPALVAALERVVLVKVDTHSDAGDPIAERFGISGIPHFVVLEPGGQIVDRWIGYGTPSSWLDSFETALSDPSTVPQKEARFAEMPTARDAATLARIRAAENRFADAVRLYGEASRLDPATGAEHAGAVFQATYRGMRDGAFSKDDVRAAAETVLAGGAADPDDLATVAFVMARMAREDDDAATAAPYVAKALAAIDATDETLAAERKDLLVLDALYVKNDKESAVLLKRDAMEEGWESTPEGLNEFAWWCFENEVNLVEAEGLARKGAALAKAGEEKAMILDTVAEICNLRGDCGEALDLIVQALAEDPENEHYLKQKARFEKCLADRGQARG